MGCSAGMIACGLAQRLLKHEPGKYALVVSTENITQNWYILPALLCCLQVQVQASAHCTRHARPGMSTSLTCLGCCRQPLLAGTCLLLGCCSACDVCH